MPAEWSDAVSAVLEEHKARPGALLPILHGIQASLGYVPAESVQVIAGALNLSRAEVHGVVSFYHDFREAPAGRTIVRICRAESCQAAGAALLLTRIKERLGLELHQTTADGAVTLEPVYCLGNCALSPAITVGSEIHGMVTPDKLDALLAPLGGVR